MSLSPCTSASNGPTHQADLALSTTVTEYMWEIFILQMMPLKGVPAPVTRQDLPDAALYIPVYQISSTYQTSHQTKGKDKAEGLPY